MLTTHIHNSTIFACRAQTWYSMQTKRAKERVKEKEMMWNYQKIWINHMHEKMEMFARHFWNIWLWKFTRSLENVWKKRKWRRQYIATKSIEKSINPVNLTATFLNHTYIIYVIELLKYTLHTKILFIYRLMRLDVRNIRVSTKIDKIVAIKLKT